MASITINKAMERFRACKEHKSFIALFNITCYNSLSQIRMGRDSLRLSFLETERRSV